MSMSHTLSRTERLLGPRPHLRLVLENQLIREIWVEGRAPIITIDDYDGGVFDPEAAIDEEGFAFSLINWRGPAWALGLSLPGLGAERENPVNRERLAQAKARFR